MQMRVIFIPCNGDKSDRFLCVSLPRRTSRIFNRPTPASERGPSLRDAQRHRHPLIDAVFDPAFSSGRIFPSNPGFSSISFLLTASICFSAGRACVALTHCWKAGVFHG